MAMAALLPGTPWPILSVIKYILYTNRDGKAAFSVTCTSWPILSVIEYILYTNLDVTMAAFPITAGTPWPILSVIKYILYTNLDVHGCPITRHTVAGTQTWVETRGEEYLGREIRIRSCFAKIYLYF